MHQLQIGNALFHLRGLGRLRQLLHRGQFVGDGFPRRRSLLGGFLQQQRIEQRSALGRQQRLDRGGQAAVMLIDCRQDQGGQGEIARHLDLVAHQHLDGAGENQLRFQVRLDQPRDSRGEKLAAVGLEGAKPVELQDRRLMPRHGLPRVVGQINRLLGRGDPIGNVRKVALMERRDGVESFGRFEVAAT